MEAADRGGVRGGRVQSLRARRLVMAMALLSERVAIAVVVWPAPDGEAPDAVGKASWWERGKVGVRGLRVMRGVKVRYHQTGR